MHPKSAWSQRFKLPQRLTQGQSRVILDFFDTETHVRMTVFNRNAKYLGVVVGSFLLLTFGVNAMAGMFGSNTFFSEVEGVVMFDGKPCPSAKVEQKVFKANSQEYTSTTVTDGNGRFSFQEVSESKGLLGFLPTEFVATQRIVIYHEGNEYLGWANTKRDPSKNSESNGKRFALICDLSKSTEEDDKYQGLCRLKAQ